MAKYTMFEVFTLVGLHYLLVILTSIWLKHDLSPQLLVIPTGYSSDPASTTNENTCDSEDSILRLITRNVTTKYENGYSGCGSDLSFMDDEWVDSLLNLTRSHRKLRAELEMANATIHTAKASIEVLLNYKRFLAISGSILLLMLMIGCLFTLILFKILKIVREIRANVIALARALHVPVPRGNAQHG